MIYKRNYEKSFDTELFRNPTSEYRAAPFWAWNCKLDKDELLYQIECMKEMGMGGFYMHSRSGMGTKYLGEEFMSLVRACADKAEQEGLLAWLYDEDRWPSGSAGGYVTKNKKYRQKIIEFRPDEIQSVDFEEGYRDGKPYLLACYDVKLNEDGTLCDYIKTESSETKNGFRWYAYVKTTEESGQFNGQTYVDVMSEEAMAEFKNITYEAYKNSVGDKFGKSIHAIFTDEPEYAEKVNLAFALSKGIAILPWTTDFAQSFKSEYGFDILNYLPELIWDLPDKLPSKARYYYHDHCCERFTKAFIDQLGLWCKRNNIELTGHMMEEATLVGQASRIGEAMRTYRSFGIPGIDILCDAREYTTAKQAQSMKNQCGAEGMLSELYGVMGWDADFRGYKLAGDWQAALGVTLRVPHLSWVTMKGTAKRDYPASFNYQAPWYKKFPVIEDHFARLNTVLTRGKQSVRLAVLHPIESVWLCSGPGDTSKDTISELEENFKKLTEWLLFGTIDFDFVSESMLPSQYKALKKGFNVGEMNYDAVLIPPIKTIRKTTINILNEYYNNGGKIIFSGDCPEFVDAEKSEAARMLYDKCVHIQFGRMSILSQLNEIRDIEIRNKKGELTDNFLYNLRQDEDCKYLFIANGRSSIKYEYNILKEKIRPFYMDVVNKRDVLIKIRGCYRPVLMDTLSGLLSEIDYYTENGFTFIPYAFYAHDSLLLKLEENGTSFKNEQAPYKCIQKIELRNKVIYRRDESNVFLLDMAQYSLANEKRISEGKEEILRIDNILRKKLNLPKASSNRYQPWALAETSKNNFAILKFTFISQIECDVEFAYEEMDYLQVNGEEVKIIDNGYYVDKAIRKTKIPTLKKGLNEIIVKAPIGERVGLENYFILGDFDVMLLDGERVICKKNNNIAFGSITEQGMPFYSGNITYMAEFETNETCSAEIEATCFRGDLIEAFLDGDPIGNIFIMPYNIFLQNLKKGKHVLELKLYGNRFNTFGALHKCGDRDWSGSGAWYEEDSQWCYEYNLRETGILKAPVIKLLKNEEAFGK